MVTDVERTVAHAASGAYKAGLSVVPIHQHPDPEQRTKRPSIAWKRFQSERATVEELRGWFADGSRTGLGIVCGAVSGNLEMLEFEGRAVDAGMFTDFCDAVNAMGYGDTIARVIDGYSEVTPSGGYHLLYRCDEMSGNTVLAAEPVVIDGVKKNKPFIETRGEGGFVVVAPSHGCIHPDGGAWIIDSGSFDTIATITPDERRALFDAARVFDLRDNVAQEERRTGRHEPAGRLVDIPGPEGSWLDAVIADYNARTTWSEVLAGQFNHVFDRGRTSYWHFIGADNRISATTNHNGTDRLHVFSGTAQANGWPDGKSTWDRFSANLFITTGRSDVASRTEHAKRVREAGYGPQDERRTATAPSAHKLVIDDHSDFWTSRPELARVYDYALAKRAGPWAALGVVLVRVSSGLTPNVVLPDLVGDYGSLNLFVGLVGPSGGGKGAATAVGFNAVEIGLLHGVEVHTPGSGHGIPHAYAHREKGDLVRDADRAIFTVEEVDHLLSLSGQTGSTLLAELRRVWMGEKLGHLFVDPTKRVPIEAHTYRAGLIVGIQPKRAGVLLDDADGGTPQRFLWLPVEHPHGDERPTTPPAWKWTAPQLLTGRNVMSVCSTLARDVDQSQLARSRGEGDPLDGHRLLCREKAAAALALLNGRLDINEEDWQLSAALLDVSDKTRAHIVDTLSEVSRLANMARARAEADRAVIINETTERATIAKVSKTVLRTLRRQDGHIAPTHILRNAVWSKHRQYVEDALEALVSAGSVEREMHTGSGCEGWIYRLAEDK